MHILYTPCTCMGVTVGCYNLHIVACHWRFSFPTHMCTYIYGCDVQQFLTAIEKMDLSNNVITDDSTGIEVSCLVLNLPVYAVTSWCVLSYMYIIIFPHPLTLSLPSFLPFSLPPLLTVHWQCDLPAPGLQPTEVSASIWSPCQVQPHWTQPEKQSALHSRGWEEC